MLEECPISAVVLKPSAILIWIGQRVRYWKVNTHGTRCHSSRAELTKSPDLISGGVMASRSVHFTQCLQICEEVPLQPPGLTLRLALHSASQRHSGIISVY